MLVNLMTCTYLQEILLFLTIVCTVLALTSAIFSPATTSSPMEPSFTGRSKGLPMGVPTSPLNTSSMNLTLLYKDSPDILAELPSHFLPEYKSFCWFRADHANSARGMQKKAGESELLCLPRVYLAGIPKCGTTDLFTKLVWHPDIVEPKQKEPHYWARQRHTHNTSFLQYLRDLHAGRTLRKDSVVIDGSPSTLQFHLGWERRYPWANNIPFKTTDLIHSITPQAKILAIVREPVARLFSAYLMWAVINKAAVTQFTFRDAVLKSINHFNHCVKEKGIKACCFDSEIISKNRKRLIFLEEGIYSCFLIDCKEKFGDNFMTVLFEDYTSSPLFTLMSIFEFLEVSKPDEGQLKSFIESARVENTRESRDHGKIDQFDMLEDTIAVLKEFYQPYNEELALYFNNTRLLFNRE